MARNLLAFSSQKLAAISFEQSGVSKKRQYNKPSPLQPTVLSTNNDTFLQGGIRQVPVEDETIKSLTTRRQQATHNVMYRISTMTSNVNFVQIV